MSTRLTTQPQIDRANAGFWDELCGSKFALENGVTDNSPESIARFDRAYFDFYPYLEGYVPSDVAAKRTLEIGLGYGTLSQRLTELGADYHGLDIARGPVEMVRERLRRLGIDDAAERVQQGSALGIPQEDASFDCAVAIGCLHHTGDIPRCVAEVHRVLRPGGRAVVMLYNRHSLRQALLPIKHLLNRPGRSFRERQGLSYDSNSAGDAAPETQFTSVREARRIFSAFDSVRIRRENFDGMGRPPLLIPRERLLGLPARLAGLDLYITARK